MTPHARVKGTSAAILAVTLWSAAACQQAPSASTAEAAPAPGVAGRAWVSNDVADAPGTVRVFLSDGTLIMDSCVEGYRLTTWRATGPSSVEWDEDTARIEAEILEASADALRLRLTLRGGEARDETYRPATVPFVCPDLPRQLADIGAGLGGAIASCQ